MPGVDDGPSSVDESLEMCRSAVKFGFNGICATPHTLNHNYENYQEGIIQAVDELNNLLEKNYIDLTIYPGCEVPIIPNLFDLINEKKIITLNTNKYLLLEFPFFDLPPFLKDEIFNLRLHGIIPVIAHPERNYFIQNDISILVELITMGCLVQITSSSLTGMFGRVVQQISLKLLKSGMVHVLATDAHSINKRNFDINKAVDIASNVLGSLDDVKQLFEVNPCLILHGEPVQISVPDVKNHNNFFYNLTLRLKRKLKMDHS